jgi:hypothetical protein
MWYAEAKRKAQALEVSTSYELKPEANLGSPITPLVEIRKQEVIDPTASRMFMSSNSLPGQITCTEQEWVTTNLGTLTDVQSQIISALDQAACHR